jgi:hypothetical protein
MSGRRSTDAAPLWIDDFTVECIAVNAPASLSRRSSHFVEPFICCLLGGLPTVVRTSTGKAGFWTFALLLENKTAGSGFSLSCSLPDRGDLLCHIAAKTNDSATKSKNRALTFPSCSCPKAAVPQTAIRRPARLCMTDPAPRRIRKRKPAGPQQRQFQDAQSNPNRNLVAPCCW